MNLVVSSGSIDLIKIFLVIEFQVYDQLLLIKFRVLFSHIVFSTV